MKNNKKRYRFNLEKLESELSDSYANYINEDNEQTRTELYKKIYNLAFAILNVGKHSKIGMDNDEAAYEYTIYLFERLISKKFVPDCDGGMPWQKYIDLNLRHILYSKRDKDWIEYIQDLDDYLNNNGFVSPDSNMMESSNKINRDRVSSSLYNSLLIFYDDESVRNMLPLALELINSDPRYMVRDVSDNKLKDFMVVLVSLSKRVGSKFNDYGSEFSSDIKDAKGSFMRSSVFLSSIINSDVMSRELFVSLDRDSLDRLVSVAGGKKIRVPTSWEINSLIGVALSLTKSIEFGDFDYKKVIKKCKKENNLTFSYRLNMNDFVDKLYQSYKTYGEDESTFPTMSMIVEVLDNFIKLLNDLDGDLFNGGKDLDQGSIRSYYMLLIKLQDTINDINSLNSKIISKLSNY